MKSGDKIKSGEKDILIMSVEDVQASRSGKRGAHLYVVCQSDSGKTYKLRVFKQATRSSCSCPSWIFRSAALAKAERLPVGERVPCVHLRTLFASPSARELLAEVRRARPGQAVATSGASVRLSLLWSERHDLAELIETRELDLPVACSPRMQAIVAELLSTREENP